MKYTAIAIMAALAAGPSSACKGADKSANEARGEKVTVLIGSEDAPASEEAEMPRDEVGRYGADVDDDKKRDDAEHKPKRKRAAAEAGTLARDPAKSPLAGKSEAAPVKTRSWFPETFLFNPLVVTDDQGQASVDVVVPDRLTTWRVLALAHSRTGSQAGATTSFSGTLPTYVDPILPPRLRAGDRLDVAIQSVNTTAKSVSTALKIQVDGADLIGSANQSVSIPAGGNALSTIKMAARRPGKAKFLARLGDADAVVRTVDVIPTGRPVEQQKSGTLAEPRSFELSGAPAATPNTGRVRLMVFPGALSILRTELSVARSRRGLADDAFALLLSGRAPALLDALGETPETDELRELSIVLSQRVVRHARTLDVRSATLLAEAALSHPDNPILSNIGQRAVRHLKDGQRPDGTCGGEDGWTLQRLLVATAECARAAKSEQDVVIRAGGAFERHADHILDPYTAAAILASGAATGDLEKSLREKVKAAIVDRKDNSKVVKVPDGVVRADGRRPSNLEATALAVLALAGDSDVPMADLGAALLSGYSPRWGWGDGRVNLVATQAIAQLFRDPLPDNIQITLKMDDEVVATGALSRDKVETMLVLEKHGIASSGAHRWSIEAEPAVPGLGYALSVTDWVAWPDAPQQQGVELVITPPETLKIGQGGMLGIVANAPSGETIDIALALPAGVQVDAAGLEQLQGEGTLSRFKVDDEIVSLSFSPLAPAKVLDAKIRVIPTLGGTLQSGATSMKVAGVTVNRPPATWTIK